MAVRAAIFDLDDTLLDSRALKAARDAKNWHEVLGRLDEVVEFVVPSGEPAVIELPAVARKRGLRVGVLTHSPVWYASALLDKFDIKVRNVVTGSDGFSVKPDPGGLEHVAQLLDIPVSDCVYIGDQVGDFGAAAAAGMRSVGVAWDGKNRESWRHSWPDIAVNSPRRLIEFLSGDQGLGLLGEEIAAGTMPVPHWGSIARLGDSTIALGRYFPTTDKRHPSHELSPLVIASKNSEDAREELAIVLAGVADLAIKNAPDIVTSVPPSPGSEDRFLSARDKLANRIGSEDRDDLLIQVFDDPDYKSHSRNARFEVVEDRFEAEEELDNERILLIDDVITSGAQAEACRSALEEAGSGVVTILAATVTQDSLPRPCPTCGEGKVQTKTNGRTGQLFLACSYYRKTGCTWTSSIEV